MMVASYNKKELYCANEKLLPLILGPWTIHGYHCHQQDHYYYCESFSSNSIHLLPCSQKMLHYHFLFISNMWEIMFFGGNWDVVRINEFLQVYFIVCQRGAPNESSVH